MFKIKKYDNYYYLKVSGKLTHQDYVEHLIPFIDKTIDQYGQINLLIETEDFHGWETRAILDDLKVDIKHHKHFNKIAIIGDKAWQKVLVDFFSLFIKGKCQYFSHEDIAMAKNWLNK